MNIWKYLYYSHIVSALYMLNKKQMEHIVRSKSTYPTMSYFDILDVFRHVSWCIYVYIERILGWFLHRHWMSLYWDILDCFPPYWLMHICLYWTYFGWVSTSTSDTMHRIASIRSFWIVFRHVSWRIYLHIEHILANIRCIADTYSCWKKKLKNVELFRSGPYSVIWQFSVFGQGYLTYFVG